MRTFHMFNGQGAQVDPECGSITIGHRFTGRDWGQSETRCLRMTQRPLKTLKIRNCGQILTLSVQNGCNFKIWNQLLKHLLKYWAETKIQDGRLAAILNFRLSRELSLLHFITFDIAHITVKGKNNLCLTSTNKCAKIQINSSNASWDICKN